MPVSTGKTFGQMQAALKNPSVYARLSNRDKQLVDEMQRRVDIKVDYEPDFRSLRLLRKIDRNA